MKTKDYSNGEIKKAKWSPHKIVSLIFVILFTAIITSFPVMYLSGVSAGKNYEKKVLTELPKINELFTNYSGFSDQFEAHFNDYFPVKSTMLEMYSLSEYKLFKKSIVPSVTSIGKNDWLFFEGDNTRSAVNGTRMLSEKTLEKIYNGIMEKYETLKKLGKKYVIYLAAEKQTIYPEHDSLYTADYTLIDQLIEYLNQKECPIPFIYSKDYLLAKKTASNQLYFKYDTHWNALGAQYGYESVMQVIKPMFPDKNIPVATEQGYQITKGSRSGDLANTIFLSKYLVESTPNLVYEHTPSYTKPDKVTIVNSNVVSDLKVFIYGDSFAQAEYWGAPFSQSASEVRILHNKNDFQVLLDNLGESDVVIEECVQRVPSTLGRVYF